MGVHAMNFAKKPPVALVVVSKGRITAREYLDINKTKPSTIKNATFVAPRIGGVGFGSFEVEYRTPKLVAA
jgi:hypothetical protein